MGEARRRGSYQERKERAELREAGRKAAADEIRRQLAERAKADPPRKPVRTESAIVAGLLANQRRREGGAK